ncbi:MAG: hypothetical protein AAFY97_10720, partial [Pseudomonadota bacterium]
PRLEITTPDAKAQIVETSAMIVSFAPWTAAFSVSETAASSIVISSLGWPLLATIAGALVLLVIGALSLDKPARQDA